MWFFPGYRRGHGDFEHRRLRCQFCRRERGQWDCGNCQRPVVKRGASAGNYTLTQPGGLTANIAAAGVAIASGVAANNKVYDRTTAATLNFNNVVLSGVIAGDTPFRRTPAVTPPVLPARTRAMALPVTVSGLTLSGASAGNYTLTQPGGLTANIAAAGVAIASGVTANNKAYDRTTAATLNFNNVVLSGVIAGDTVASNTGSYTASFAGANVGNGIAVTVSVLALSGASAGNYTLTQPGGLTANIAAAGVAIASGVTANTKVYDRTTAATLGFNNVVLSGVIAGDTVTPNTGGYAASFAGANAGNGIAVTVSGLALSGASAGNDTLTQPGGLTANIAPAAAAVASGITANNKLRPHDCRDSQLQQCGAFRRYRRGHGDSEHRRLRRQFCRRERGQWDCGNCQRPGVERGQRWQLHPHPTGGLTASIAPAGVAVASGITALTTKCMTALTAATLSFNNVVLSGVIAGDTVALNTGGYAASFAGANAGVGIVVTVSGLALSGASAGNYTLTQPGGLTANIAPAGVAVASGVTANTKVYDRTTAATLGFNNVVLSGVIAGDTVTLNTGGYTANFAGANAGVGLAVTVSGLALSGASAGNYTLTQPGGLTANIAAAGVAIASGVTANNKVYDRTTAATLNFSNVVLSGVIAGDTVTLNTNGYTANFASVSVGNGIAVTVTGLTLSGASAGNYTLAQPGGLTANITRPSLQIVASIPNIVLSWTTNASDFVLNRQPA